jgi:hypothetical protein
MPGLQLLVGTRHSAFVPTSRAKRFYASSFSSGFGSRFHHGNDEAKSLARPGDKPEHRCQAVSSMR